MIPDSFVQDLLARVDIVEVVGRYVQLRKGGSNLLGLCPFHQEKSPSFTVSPSKQFYHCFGCGANGDAVGFLIAHTGTTFPEAVRTLAASVGMSVPEPEQTPRQRAARRQHQDERSRHQQALDTAQAFYRKALEESDAARRYLTERGLDEAMIERYGLGWSPAQRRGLSAVFSQYDDPLLVEAGLVVADEDGSRHDRFRGRIMFPIRNTRGHIVGFGGRVVGQGTPKYLNSPETLLFSKSLELYGLWEARAGIRREASVMVVEGYMDVVALARHGLDHAVATLGTATTADHLQKLLRASDRVVFCFDGDAAGRRAAWRALNTSLPLARDDVSLRFLFLPPEHDPDSYVRHHGAAAMRAALAESLPLSRFLLEELASRHALDEAEGRAALVHEALPLVNTLPEGALRPLVESELGRLARLTPEELSAVWAQQQAREARRTQPPAAVVAAPAPPPEVGVPHEPPPAGGRVGRGGRERSRQGGGRAPRMAPQSRMVTPIARRLVRLLLVHPHLAGLLGDQQLEILERDPQLHLVRALVVLVNSSGAAHAGALRAAMDEDSPLCELVDGLLQDVLQDEWTDPETEWREALTRIELSGVMAEQSALAAGGLVNEDQRRRFQELNRRLLALKAGGSAKVK